ncbi:MAG: tyrosine-type recombinase/integrase [Pseudomonadota bacterium]|uniref:tyrosine-type recombinase/integrase n=1 Tax=Gallaecimonas pentaromativorans TaxID=584787 RepID=UPI00067EC4DF|nr:tyrosine-type recombinase/integrase [Gallaecimonas pentaromativorans]MED5525428.1 tyrosine-type recombinase/integrase [Pseudomonadota bacterium]
MNLVKIRFGDSSFSWTVVDADGEPIDVIRHWIVHLEQTNFSPNTVEAYARQIARLGRFLSAKDKSLRNITVSDYDDFLQWLPYGMATPDAPPQVLPLNRQFPRLSSSLSNQVHLAVKSFYRFLTGQERFEVLTASKSSRFQGIDSYKPFLEHINQRRSVRKRDPYLKGDIGLVQKRVSDKRLTPEQVLRLIRACNLMRDAFLVTLLYNTGMRIGEALGLRHTDIDMNAKVIWVVPRNDNENNARAKSGRTRAIPVAEYVIEMYEDFITSDEYMEAFESGTEYVFCNVHQGRIGKALSRSYASNLKEYLEKRTSINFSWHRFRHTHASEAIADGYGLLEVADRLGHASPQTTADFYKHIFSQEVRKLHLTGPEKLKKRLEEFRQLANTTDRGIGWI